ncbi:MAG: helix-turn-helix transcriptional regulator [Pseudobdellovibrio sp.]
MKKAKKTSKKKKDIKMYIKSKTRMKLTVGKAIRIGRDLMKWSQKQLAIRTGISRSVLSRLENDKVHITKKQALKLASVLKIHRNLILEK